MRTVRLPLVLLAASLACPFAAAQQNPPIPSQPASKNASRAIGNGNGSVQAVQVLSVEFAGGTLGEFVEAVKSATPETINVVVPADAMNVSVPRLSLKNVSPYMALQSLEYISDRTTWMQPAGQGIPNLMMSNEIEVLDLNRKDPAANDSSRTFAIVYTKRSRGFPSGMEFPGTAPTTQVFTVRDLLATDGKGGGLPGLTLDQIVQPIEATLTVESEDARAKGADPARLMVHKESNLVIVKGNARQNALVKQVIEQLKEDVERTRSEVLPERERLQLVEDLRRQYSVRKSTLEQQLIQTHERMADLRKLYDNSVLEKNERSTATAQAALRQVEAAASTLEAQLQQAKQQQEEAEFEATRQWRTMGNNSSVAEIRALREQMDLLKKQLEELKAAARPASTR